MASKQKGIDKEYFCSVPLRDIYINNEGCVRLCEYAESYIGNIAEDDIGMILKSESASIEKRRLSKCKNPCDYCIHRSLFDYYQIFKSYLKN